MRKIVINIILTFGIILLVFTEIFLFLRIKDYNNIKLINSSSLSLIQMLKNEISNGFSNNDVEIKPTIVSCGLNDTLYEVFPDPKHLPAFIVYIPYSENTCSSCITYAIEKAKSFFKDFESDPRISLISDSPMYFLNERYFKKKILYLNSKDHKLGIPADNDKNPHYFIITKENKVNLFFSPNSLYPEITEKYFEQINRLLELN